MSRLSGHVRLISQHCASLEQYAVCRDLVPCVDLNNVPNQQLIDRKILHLPTPRDRHGYIFGQSVQFLELSLLHVVVPSRDADNDDDSRIDGHPLEPAMGNPVLPDAHEQGDQGGQEQDSKHVVFKTVQNHGEQSLLLDLLLGVGPEVVPSLLDFFFLFGDAVDGVSG